ncbi:MULTISPECIES: DUF1775 domain-containing protein [unclassified Streptomyces]|uniref:DUF1775 domain-containing protein n=1 Tax=unclassified Streptomyces TaxID=2593676 RepID=UPI003369C5A6
MGACARAGAFAVLGTVLATFGHHAIAGGTVPWRLVSGLAAAQFAAVWPLARRHRPPTGTMLFTLATQGVLHLALSRADGDTPAGMPGHAAHAGHLTAAPCDGHAWHHAGTAMMTVHALAALAVAWLLHRADARMVAALDTLRTLTRAAAAALVRALPRPVTGAGRQLRLPGRQAWARDDLPVRAEGEALRHVVVRRGPPQPEHHLRSRTGPSSTGPVNPVAARSSPVPKCPHPPARTGRRIALAGAAALTSVLALAAPAAAHAEVEADTPQALAENVTLSFVSEAESDSAGFRELRIVLPDGIAPGEVSLADAPKGWRMKATADGYTVGGPALNPGVNAEHKIKVDRLPDAKEIAFKTVETYGDGQVSRWIELPRGGGEPEQPAPVLKLKAAAADAKPASPSPTPSAAPAEASPATAGSAAERDATPAAEKAAGESDGLSSGVLIGVIVAVLLVLAGGVWWLIRRRVSASQS